MKKLVALLALAISTQVLALEQPGWRTKNSGSPQSDTTAVQQPLHGAPSTASSYDFGYCAASIVNTKPATAQRLYNDAKDLDQFKMGFLAYVEMVNREPVRGWQRAAQACSGNMLQDIRFEKQDRRTEKEKK